ncbi:MAG: pentapeptide repeat-containing protein [Ilumatobacteraceae bacterium]
MSRPPAGTPHAPRLGTLSASAADDLLIDHDWYEVEVAGSFAGAELDGLTMQGVRCRSAQFTAALMERSRLIDVAFESCELSGVRLEDVALTRVEFRDCRLSGAQLNASRMTDVRFIDCRLDGAAFRMVHGDRVWFEGSNLVGSELYGAELTAARFERCDLTGVDFSQARIPDASLRGSELHGIRGIGGLQRPVIDEAQVLPLAYSLMSVHGVVVHTEDDE